MKPALRIGVVAAALFVIAMLVWQGVSAQGAPDPTRPNTSPTVAFLDIGVLVFREGLECILVLAAITASMTGPKRTHRRPVAFGAGLAFVATLITWCIAVRIVGSLSDNMSALDRKSTRLNSSHSQISYAVFRLKQKHAKTVPRRLPARSPLHPSRVPTAPADGRTAAGRAAMPPPSPRSRWPRRHGCRRERVVHC